jgi:hypothetical protein
MPKMDVEKVLPMLASSTTETISSLTEIKTEKMGELRTRDNLLQSACKTCSRQLDVVRARGLEEAKAVHEPF